MDYVRSRPVSLKAHPTYNERWLQEQIASDPTLLGLGVDDLDVKDVERRQPRAGRLDVLLYDAENSTRYEVEIQLGPTDESHIIRTLEYWDNERRRFPQYEHVAVIVAEEITGRFLNVINLFNQAIPLIAVQMSALEVNGAMTLHATKVLDVALPAAEEDDDSGRETDRNYWEARSAKPVMKALDALAARLQADNPHVGLKYNKHYIGLQRHGIADNFVTFRPRKKHVIVEPKIERSETIDSLIENWGLTTLPYDKRWNRYRLQLEPDEVKDQEVRIYGLLRIAEGIPVDEALSHVEREDVS